MRARSAIKQPVSSWSRRANTVATGWTTANLPSDRHRPASAIRRVFPARRVQMPRDPWASRTTACAPSLDSRRGRPCCPGRPALFLATTQVANRQPILPIPDLTPFPQRDACPFRCRSDSRTRKSRDLEIIERRRSREGPGTSVPACSATRPPSRACPRRRKA
jgi:hypothetical protein